MKSQQLTIVAEQPSTNETVLRIATVVRNSVTQLFRNRPQIFLKQIADLDKKIARKLALHQIFDVTTSVCIAFQNDQVRNLPSIADLEKEDFEKEVLTESISLRWSFVFDPAGQGDQHLHSIFIKISELPTAGLFLQKMLSTRTDDLENPDRDIFSPIACKLDFADSRFSSEVLALVAEWVEAQPRAETVFGFVKWLGARTENITSFIANTLPPLVVLAYVGAWLGYIPHSLTNSTKYSASYVLGGGAIFLIARYVTSLANSFFVRHMRRISTVPIFQITAGDRNKMTTYLASSQKSVIVLAIGGLIYGFFKAIGIYLASLVITSPVMP